MSYQSRLSQLESEIFQNGNSSSPTSPILPYLIICVVVLVLLYISCPNILTCVRNRRRCIDSNRFTTAWLIVSVLLCVAYYKYIAKMLSSQA